MATIQVATSLPVRRVPGTTCACKRPGREDKALERLWGWRTCDRCGETIMLGDGSRRLRHDGGADDVCLDCACAPSDLARNSAL